ncbi:sensor histidine kinase [Planomonospora corallina]|uniref:Sensor histidine kinase n=1 Tax=Planomonospora corallina TaxID=1806052 RepID=A0ABV8I7F9_9ACTN
MIGDWMSRFGWTLVLAMVGALAVTRVGDFLREPLPARDTALGVAAIAAVAALHVVIVMRPWRPHLLLAAQAFLVFAPYLALGRAWGPLSGFLGAAVLLTLPAPLSWPLFALTTATDTAIGAYHGSDPLSAAGIAIVVLNTGLGVFAVTHLARRLDQATGQRERLAALAAERERLESAARLRGTLGTGLSTIIQLIRDGLTAPTTERLARVADLGRTALAAARTIADAQRVVVPAVPPAPDADRTARIRPRLAWWFLVLMLADHSAITVLSLALGPRTEAGVWALAGLLTAVSVGLQLYHGAPRAPGSEPRAWPWTLTLHGLVVVIATAIPFWPPQSILAPLLPVAGAAVVRLRRLWAWAIPPLFALMLALVSGRHWTGAGDYVYWSTGVIVITIQVYALCRIPEVTRELEETSGDVARVAAVTERLRLARDLHDLLGMSLSGISLKAELAARLLPTDPDRARRELSELLVLAERARDEVRSLTTELFLPEEIAAARSILEAAGLHVTVSTSGPPPDAPLLAVALREAVTNVIRHSAARTCRISVVSVPGRVRLRVTNDGLAPAVPERPGTGPMTAQERRGTGLAGLTERITRAGGRLDAGQRDDTFTLTASLPQ